MFGSCFQALSCSVVVHMVNNVKALLSETELLLAGKMSMVMIHNNSPSERNLQSAPVLVLVLVLMCCVSVYSSWIHLIRTN